MRRGKAMYVVVRKSLEMNKSEKEIRTKLKEADRDGDGWLSKDDLKCAFRELGARVPEWRAFRSLQRIDSNKDRGMISTSGPEFEELVKYALTKYGFKVRK